MKSMKKANLSVLLVCASALFFALGCANPTTEPAQIVFPSQINGVMGGAANIAVIDSNLGSELGELVTHDWENVLTGAVPYLPVLKTNLYNGTAPYLTFTFDKAIKQVFASTIGTGTNEFAGDDYVFDVAQDNSRTKKLLGSLPVISGSTVTFNLPQIAITGVGSTYDDGKTFVVGNRYLVDFFIQATNGQLGRVTIAFTVKDANTEIGPLTGIQIYGKTAGALNPYSLYLIDRSRVFFLNRGTAATHTTPATAAEQVGNPATTLFDTWETRYNNGNAVNTNVYDSLNALAIPANNRTSNLLRLNWTAVANATEYQIYTTDDTALTKDWVRVGTEAADTIVAGVAAVPEYYDFNLAAYPIGAYRAVRIVPVNNVAVGTAAVLQLLDEVRPVTSRQDNEAALDNFQINAVFTGHLHDGAEADGEVIATGSKNLALITQPDQTPEAYRISNVTGTLAVSSTATNQGIMPLALADFDVPVLATDRTFQLGDFAVGVLHADNTLTVYVHVRCYLSPSGTITYIPGNSLVTGNLSVTYTDLAGNLMISRSSTGVSKNSGIIIFVEN